MRTATIRRPMEHPSAVARDGASRTMRSPRHAWPLWLLVAWGIILFGAVYQWAYIPLLTAAAATGAYGWWTSPPRYRQPAHGVLVALLAVACVVAIQLIPLPAAWLNRVDRFCEDMKSQGPHELGGHRARLPLLPRAATATTWATATRATRTARTRRARFGAGRIRTRSRSSARCWCRSTTGRWRRAFRRRQSRLPANAPGRSGGSRK